MRIVRWGSLLWLIGYVLGFVFYAFVPAALIGWDIMPLGIAITAIVLLKWVRVADLHEAARVGVMWTLLAIALDYAFIVLLLHPADGYYKLDVYIYYALTLLMPIAAALLRGVTSTSNMATSPEMVEFVLEKLGDHDVFAVRQMFGEYALYADGKTVALICDDLLHVKIVPQSASLKDVCEIGEPYPGARPHYVVAEDQLSRIEDLPYILRDIAAALPRRMPKRKTRR